MKIWLTGLTSKGREQDLRELIEPIKDKFDGLVWVFNGEKDAGFDYLDSEKKEGKIIHAEWCNRFDFSRNLGLFCSPIKYGDWFVVIDDQERMSVEFANSLHSILKRCKTIGVDGLYIHNKHFAFIFNEQMKFVSNPHCGVYGTHKGMELVGSNVFKEEWFTNVRPLKRGKFEFVKTNIKYYLYPNTNHLLLHFESDPEYVKYRYYIRSKFLSYMSGFGADTTSVDSITKALRENPPNDELIDIINSEKILNDWYRFEFLGDTDIVDDPNPALIKQV